MNLDIDKERAAFEAWAKTHFGCSEYSFARAYEQGYYNTVHSNTYGGRKQAEYAPVSMLWDAWQAARIAPPAPILAAAEGRAGAEEWMRKAIAETRTAASLFDAGGFRAGMETACDEIEKRMDLDGDIHLAAAVGQAEVLRDLYAAAYREPAGPTFGAIMAAIQTLQAEAAALLPRQAAVGLSDTDRLDWIAKKHVLGASYAGIGSVNAHIHLDDYAVGGVRYAIDCMIERYSAAPQPQEPA